MNTTSEGNVAQDGWSGRLLQNALLYLRFGLSGGAATGIYMISVTLATALLGMGDMPAHLLSFFIALPSSYFLQKYFTFRDLSRHAQSFPRFFATSVVAFILSTGSVHLGTKIFGWPQLLTFAVAITLVTAANFFVMLLWVFVERE